MHTYTITNMANATIFNLNKQSIS